MPLADDGLQAGGHACRPFFLLLLLLLLPFLRLARPGAAGPSQAPLVAGDGLAGVLAQVVPDMPAVRHLDRPGSAGAGSLGIGAGPVPADHLHLRVLLEPFPRWVSFPGC